MNRFHSRSAVAALAALMLAACGSSTGPDDRPRPVDGTDAFDSNSLPQYLNFGDLGYTGNWTFTGGELVASGPADQAVLVRSDVSFTNGWVETTSTRADDGGLVLRFASAGDYYLLAFRDDAAPAPRGDRNLAVYHHSGTDYNEMWTKDIEWARGTRHTIRFEAAGTTLKVYFDGALLAAIKPAPEINDPTPSFGPGRAGLRVFGYDGGWMTRFESLTWHGDAS